MKLIFGVGINDKSRPSRENGKQAKEYDLWRGMLGRCFDEKIRSHTPTYVDCTVSENFKNYEYFYDWCQNQIGFRKQGYHLDKDLLSGENKIYSEDTCVFIPCEINSQFSGGKTKQLHLPAGITWNRDRWKDTFSYLVRISKKGKLKHIGRWKDLDPAIAAYTEAKKAYLLELAEEHKDNIDPRAYQALLRISS